MPVYSNNHVYYWIRLSYAILQTNLEVVLQYIIVQASAHTHIQLTNSLIKVFLHSYFS